MGILMYHFPNLKIHCFPQIIGCLNLEVWKIIEFLKFKVHFPIEAMTQRALMQSLEILFNLDVAKYMLTTLFFWETSFHIVGLWTSEDNALLYS